MPGGKRPGAGRKKGIPNKITTTVKEAIVRAFDELGGHRWLVTLGTENPTAFATLLGKIVPTEITGKDGGPIETADRSKRDIARFLIEELGPEAVRALLAKQN